MGHSLMPVRETLLCMEPDYYLLHKLLTAALFMADGPTVYVLKLLECGQLPLSLSHKNPNTVYIKRSLESPSLKGFTSLQG